MPVPVRGRGLSLVLSDREGTWGDVVREFVGNDALRRFLEDIEGTGTGARSPAVGVRSWRGSWRVRTAVGVDGAPGMNNDDGVEAVEDVFEKVRARGKDCFDGGTLVEAARFAFDWTFLRPPGRGGRSLFLPSVGFFLALSEVRMFGGDWSCCGVTGKGMLRVEPDEWVPMS